MTGTQDRSSPDWVLFCDADGCLFPSEVPAYQRSAKVLNAMLSEHGIGVGYVGETLRLAFTGMNFRTTAARICAEHGVQLQPDVLERWVRNERDAVTAHLRAVLRPDPGVKSALRLLSMRYELAVVSSSAASRVNACLDATDLGDLFHPSARLSAEDSLAEPVSKPNPAIYRLAIQRCTGPATLMFAIEDSAVGVSAAAAAGVPVLGLLHFTPPHERSQRASELLDAGAVAVAETWQEVSTILIGSERERTSS